VKGLFLEKKLRVRGVGERGPINLTLSIPRGLFAPMENNLAGARSVEALFEGGRTAAALPAPAAQGYGQPQISYAQPAPQLGAPPSQPIPPQNAPGYASVPPPVAKYGVAPAPGPASAPYAGPPSAPQGNYPPRAWS
jgi:hypothetical protein